MFHFHHLNIEKDHGLGVSHFMKTKTHGKSEEFLSYSMFLDCDPNVVASIVQAHQASTIIYHLIHLYPHILMNPTEWQQCV